VQAAFLDGDGSQLGQAAVGPVTVEQRGMVTKLLPQSRTVPLPAGTRSIRVSLVATRVDGSYNEAIFDNVSLTLGEQPAPQAALSARCNLKKKTVTLAVKPTGGLRIASVAFSVKGAPAAPVAKAPFLATLPANKQTTKATAKVTDTAGRTTTLTAPTRCA
jgi:hypothetical protein